MRWSLLSLLLLGLAIGCGEGSGGAAGTGGSSGGGALAKQSIYSLRCTIDTLILEIPIELSYELNRPYVAGGSADLTFSATITFTEQASTDLIDAGIDKVDIIALEIAPWIEGATPPMVASSLTAPINDFNLELDTDNNGTPGPHRFELDTATVTTRASEDADAVELGLGLEQVFLVLGDFQVPTDCVGSTLVGFSIRFPVQ